MCGDKSTTFYLCFYLLIRRLRIVGHVWRQVNHVLSFNLAMCFYLLIPDGWPSCYCSVGHVWRQVNHVLFVFLSFN